MLEILAPVLGSWWLWTNANEDYYNAKEWAERTHDHCEMRYVGKQPLDPTAESIPLIPPVGEPYILFKQFCWNGEVKVGIPTVK